jgi:L-fucose isomerase-like protein
MPSASARGSNGGVALPDRGVKVAPRPTLGIIAIAKINHQKDENKAFLEHLKERYGRNDSIGTIIEPTVLFDEVDITNRARRIQEEGADCVLLIVGTWIYSSIVVAAVNDLHCPFVLWGYSERIANGNLGASLQIRYVLEEIGKNFLYLAGPSRDEANHDAVLKYLRAAWVQKALRGRKIATIGGKCMMMYQTQVNEYSWKRTFGVDFPQYDTAQVFKEMENVPDDEARKVEKDFLAKVNAVHWEAGEDKPEKDAVFTQAKMFLAFKRLQKLYGIDVFANKCMPEMSAIPYGYGYAGCLATCMLNEAGIMTACEADVPACLSMYILHLLSGRPVFFADIARLNKPERRITFFNCGTAPMSLADPKRGVELWPMPGNIADEAVPEEYYCGKMKGLTVKFDLENDREVTLLRIGGNDGTLRFHVALADTCPREVEPDEIIGNRWPGFGIRVRGDLQAFLEHTVGHHYCIAYGNYAEELRDLAKIYGIRYVLDA